MRIPIDNPGYILVKEFSEGTKLSFTSNIKNPKRYVQHDLFFSSLTPWWSFWIHQEKYRKAEEIWSTVIRIAQEWESSNNEHVHKGTAFYFWAVTCFEQDDIERGFLLMNEAYLEDVVAKRKESELQKAPASLFLRFVVSEKAQFYRKKLEDIKDFLANNLIRHYSSSRKRNFTFSDFEDKFLKSKEFGTPIKFHFNLYLFMLEKIVNRGPPIRDKNTIASVFYLGVLFGFCKGFEKILNPKQGLKKAITNLAEDYKNLLRFPVSKGKNSSLNGCIRTIKIAILKIFKRISNFIKKYVLEIPLEPKFGDFEYNDFKPKNRINTLRLLITSNYSHKGYHLDAMERDLLVSYVIRNAGAHEIFEDPFLVQEFPKIIKSVLNSIMLAIELH
ncbi:MAG: hypothetical protein ACTSUP_02835 [Candidatus Heimdallarchaeaceae archaeon]